MSAFSRSTIATLSATALLLGAAGCVTETETVYEQEPDILAPDFPEGTGQVYLGDTELDYPPGPYGFGYGSTLPNWAFIGYQHPPTNMAEPDETKLKYIQLADFYNPTGDGVYPEGSAFPPGTPKPKALLLVMSAVWCGPCNQEAQSILPGRYNTYWPNGEFLTNLAENMQGDPTMPYNLDAWASSYVVNYPLVLDPTEKLMTLAENPAWPMNAIVDTRTMTLVFTESGVVQANFWTLFEQVIDGNYEIPF